MENSTIKEMIAEHNCVDLCSKLQLCSKEQLDRDYEDTLVAFDPHDEDSAFANVHARHGKLWPVYVSACMVHGVCGSGRSRMPD